MYPPLGQGLVMPIATHTISTGPLHIVHKQPVTLIWGPHTLVPLLDCRILKTKLLTLFRFLFASLPTTSIPV